MVFEGEGRRLVAARGWCMSVLLIPSISFMLPGIVLGQTSPATPQATAPTVAAPATPSQPSTGNVPPPNPGTVGLPAPNMEVGGSPLENQKGGEFGPPTYDPSGRRDPFTALIQRGDGSGVENKSLPPLQRVGLTELNIIGVIWGGFGFTAMVQTPDGKGYSVRRGTRVGPNNGVVTSITKKGIVVTERFTDIYGRQQEREYVKLLHTEEELE